MEKKGKYVLGKLLQFAVGLLLLSILVFVIARLCPGDPLRAYYGDQIEHMSQTQKEAAREALGLQAPLPVQYVQWLSNALQGDLGISYQYKQPVDEIIGALWKNTVLLGGSAYVLTFGLAVGLGAFCALREDSRLDRVICKIGIVSANTPTFFVALVLLLIFSVQLNLLPVGGAYTYGGGDVFDRFLHLILPVSVLVLEHLWYYAYMIRNKLLEEIRQDYVLLCKAKGLSRRQILWGDCMKNILPSLLTLMAISLPHILGGTYVVESIFAYPGLGTLSMESAMYQDYNMLMALTMLTGAVVLLFSMIAQTVNAFVDPRMAHEERRQTA